MSAPSPLTIDSIHETIEQVCDGSKFRRTEDLGRGEFLFGIIDENKILTSFYLAYSTWDGRFLYLDETGYREPSKFLTMSRILSEIAVRLNCRRFTWQYLSNEPFFDHSIYKPEVLDGWLTLQWKRKDIEKFRESSENDIVVMGSDIHAIIQTCLNKMHTNKFRMRLATANDLDHMARLVQGLADFENEPDAVHVTKEHYRNDGFGDLPLFFCILLEDQGYPCGMGFCYLSRRHQSGRFLYLEDLFIEEKHRGNGAGGLVMRALASIALSLNCSGMRWQALDWNTPALTFYDKIGARVIDGLVTARFAGDELIRFAQTSPNA